MAEADANLAGWRFELGALGPVNSVTEIKKETGKAFVASALGEQLPHGDEPRGERRGKKIVVDIERKAGEEIGRIRGALAGNG